ncbi:MAG TPA: undecaprenyldiphospho-muramoylpentapeptide beta-N-acetylglucosaminyltransferase [Enterovirga sp.]|nr:undecaprenyldiphospho-muramoylpentapeptide beta-N-acetylglucosaminyltransferase [Enterovirga sp.]
MSKNRLIVIAAGGTGGHLFPAEALATTLKRLHVRTVLATDGRVDEMTGTFPAESVVTIPSATPSVGSVLDKAKAAVQLGRGFLAASSFLRRLRPDCVVGFGGYPTVPPVMAAAMLGIPTIIHEQNGVVGRANRFLMRRVTAIATGFAHVGGLPVDLARKAYHTGSPVRPAVLVAAERAFSPLEPGGTLQLLVFGGSQGARVMSDVVPAAIVSLSPEERARLHVVQQARPEDIESVRRRYAEAGIRAEIEAFFSDLPARIAASHLIVSRSGASTVAELGVIGRPSILVPLPGAIDRDQAANARSLAEIGAATVIPQPDFTPKRLAAELRVRLDEPARLTEAAAAAKSAGITDASERLAAIVMSLGHIDVADATAEIHA